MADYGQAAQNVGYGSALAGSHQAQYATPPTPPPINPSVFNAFDGIQSEANHLLSRARNLADRLAGVQPEANSADKAPSANGLLEDAQMRLGHIRSCIVGAIVAIERIEGKLP